MIHVIEFLIVWVVASFALVAMWVVSFGIVAVLRDRRRDRDA